ncbi:MAG: AI-2E family transporter [Campylobacterota bacterium]|nr:AI-2E family transporter [Campylobacterota bacterium]
MIQEHKASEIFIVMAAVIVVLAGIKSAAVIVEPFLLSMFIAIIFAPLFGWLNDRGLPSAISLIVVVVLIVFIIGLVGILIGSSVDSFSNNLPFYEQRLHEQFQAIIVTLDSYGIEVPKEELGAIFDTHKLMRVAAGGLKSLGGMLTNGLVIILTVVFMLLESIHLAKKIDEADGEKNTVVYLDDILDKIKKYMVLKTFVSLLTGALVWTMLMLFEIDYPVLWAVFAFLLNYIPNIGSLIAAFPAVLLAIVQFGFIPAIEIAIGYIVINIVIGSILEPKIMGSGLGLSTLVVFLSLIFWGWLLGPVGMLLSIPLTIMAKIIFDSQPNTRWIAIMLGTGEK